MIAGSGGGTGVTTYAENMGVMAVTRVYSTLVFVAAGIIALVLGFSPKFGAVIGTIPVAVLGGLAVVVFGLIAATAGPDLGREQGRFLRAEEPADGRDRADPRRRRPQAADLRLRARRHRHGDVRRDRALSPAEPQAGLKLAPAVA